MKLSLHHMVGQRREGTFPFPEMITLTPDLKVGQRPDRIHFSKDSECVPYLSGKTAFADKSLRSDFIFL